MAGRTHDTGNNALTLGFAFLAGLGALLIIGAAIIGVVQGAAADDSAIGLLFAVGLLSFVSGLGAWLAVKRPWESFDDINVPNYHGHHHGDEHDTTEQTIEKHA